MPILNLRCPKGHTWEALKSFSTADPDATRCPKCGSTEIETLPAGFAAVHNDGKDLRPEDLPEGERKMVLENKRQLESQAADILSGKLTINERGPHWTRPQVPENLKRKYF